MGGRIRSAEVSKSLSDDSKLNTVRAIGADSMDDWPKPTENPFILARFGSGLAKQPSGERPKQSSTARAVRGRGDKTNVQRRPVEPERMRGAAIGLSKATALSQGIGFVLKESLRAEPNQGPNKDKGYLQYNRTRQTNTERRNKRSTGNKREGSTS